MDDSQLLTRMMSKRLGVEESWTLLYSFKVVFELNELIVHINYCSLESLTAQSYTVHREFGHR